MWRRVIAGLRSGARLLAPDLRGFGWSEAPGQGYDGETFAADQVALLDALGVERAFVIGHDWGGWTALLLGLLHPSRVERMLVCNSPHPWARVAPSLALEAWRSWYTWIIAMPGLGRRSLEHGWIARNILTRGNVGTPFSASDVERYVESFANRRAPTPSYSSTATTSVPSARPSPDVGATPGSPCPPFFYSAPATATCRRSCSRATSPSPTTCGWSS